MDQIEASVREAVVEIFDEIEDPRQFNVAAEISVKVPIRAIARMVGVPPEARELFEHGLGWNLVRVTNPMYAADRDTYVNGTLPGLQYLLDTISARRQAGDPGEDFIGTLVATEIDGERLSDLEILSVISALVTAGADTAVDLHTLAIQALLKHPDQRALLRVLADEGSLLELRPTFGIGIITALARIEGRPVGVLANDPRHLSGAIDGPAADKAARFLQLCDAFGLPVVSVCDTPGFMVGPEAETTATVRRFSRMMTIGANATVPIVMVVTRKAYGLGAMAMAGGDSRVPVATLSWPTGEFGGMGLEGFVRLAYRAELAAIEDPAARKARYQELVEGLYEQGRALSVAGVFEIDNVIDPADTRREVTAALRLYEAPSGDGRRRLVEPW